ncbi:unnamed protein product, partial [Sphenostylis stenocarpa]
VRSTSGIDLRLNVYWQMESREEQKQSNKLFDELYTACISSHAQPEKQNKVLSAVLLKWRCKLSQLQSKVSLKELRRFGEVSFS